MRFYLAVIALLTLFAIRCNGTTGSRYENQIPELIAKVDRLEAEVSALTAEVSALTTEVAPRTVGASVVTTFNPAPFLGQFLEREIAEIRRLPESFWNERLSQARLGLMGGAPTYEDVLDEKEYYEGWLDYTNWLRQNSNGFTRALWQVGDEHLSRLDYRQLQLEWLIERGPR